MSRMLKKLLILLLSVLSVTIWLTLLILSQLIPIVDVILSFVVLCLVAWIFYETLSDLLK